ncbi:MAG: GC-type dockerin domain-anchored protein [Planctomycetota bacterium]
MVFGTSFLSVCAGLAVSAEQIPGNFIGPIDDNGQAMVACGLNCSHAGSARLIDDESVRAMIRAQTFWSLPERHRAQIAAGLAERGKPLPLVPGSTRASALHAEHNRPMNDDEFESAYASVEQAVSREAFAEFSPIHRRMLAEFAEVSKDLAVPVMPCFTPGTSLELIAAFEAILFPAKLAGDEDGLIFGRFEQTDRWNSTAMDPGGGGQGNPTILTYSFPPDGTFIPSGVGEPAAGNDLNEFMNNIYGNQETWRALYDQIFQEWEDVSGNTYMLEENDDGEPFDFNLGNGDQAAGVAGVRGDLRMAGKFIDGQGGPEGNILAYNAFPQLGDMVVDTGDPFYFNTAGNSIRLRNILAHEHGHGMGQLHVCPATGSWLMEPFINLGFDGPQFDDILNAQRFYGDPNEPNDDIENATFVASFPAADVVLSNVSIDDDLDPDVYEIEIDSPTQLIATVDPLGSLYQAGPETQDCNEPQPYNPSVFLNPGVEVLDQNGVVIASSNTQPAAVNEVLEVNLAVGTYYVRVFGSQPQGDQIIAYSLVLATEQLGPVITLVPPSILTPGVETAVTFNVDATGLLNPTATLSYRAAGEAVFTTVPATSTGGSGYEATLPAFLCGDDPEFFVEASSEGSFPSRLPESGQFQTIVGDEPQLVLNDNAEVNIGWLVSGNASDGIWELGFPQGNNRSDPPVDADGSGQAWLTGINPNDDNSDVDDGQTILTSPVFDFSLPGSLIYAYWYNNDINPQVGQNLIVEFSVDDGGTWTEIRRYNTSADIWREDTINVGTEIGTPGDTLFRFIATDEGANQGVIEAGLDAIRIFTIDCIDPQSEDCPADINGDGKLLADDFTAWLNAFLTNDFAADINGDGKLLGDDFTAWLNSFLVGCP